MYLESVPKFSDPEITVTPEMTFRAQWSSGPEAHFAASFRPNGMVSFVVFCPDPRRPEQVQRLAGIVAWDSLNEVLKPYKVERWTQSGRS